MSKTDKRAADADLNRWAREQVALLLADAERAAQTPSLSERLRAVLDAQQQRHAVR